VAKKTARQREQQRETAEDERRIDAAEGIRARALTAHEVAVESLQQEALVEFRSIFRYDDLKESEWLEVKAYSTSSTLLVRFGGLMFRYLHLFNQQRGPEWMIHYVAHWCPRHSQSLDYPAVTLADIGHVIAHAPESWECPECESERVGAEAGERDAEIPSSSLEDLVSPAG
jgi:hypothetical protein